jgi:hypothetical protein
MKKTIYAVELTLTEIIADVDTDGATVPGSSSTKTTVYSHYDGSHNEAAARAIYDACNDVIKQAQR